MSEFRKAKESEAEECYRVLDEARAFQRSIGLHQWTDGYPSLEDVQNDLKAGTAYVLTDGQGIEGYLSLSFNGEKAYEDPEAHFRLDAPYGVIHRLGIGKNGHRKGYADKMLLEAEKVCLEKGVTYLRIDTHEANSIMRHVLEKNGYKRCGTVKIHGLRLAYDKILNEK